MKTKTWSGFLVSEELRMTLTILTWEGPSIYDAGSKSIFTALTLRTPLTLDASVGLRG